ncbi:TPA: LacI family transcriptional regulator [Candidatus Bipolaricaulota bacterium]|nr:LacI family transcriptional regulator [Candidatus Bipolaricaulota bacterium]
MNRSPTIRDVAKRAGVAVSTASLALNGKPYVSRETRFKVLQAAEELGYHPHTLAKNLADGRTRNLGLITPISLEHLFASAGFFSCLIRGMHRAAAEHGYNLSLHIAESEDEAVSRVRAAIRGRSVDGLIITNPTVTCPYLRDLKRHRIPFVFIGRPSEEATYVDNDNVEVSRIGVRHLIECGHSRIAFLNGPAQFTFCVDRLLGYRAALAEAGLSHDEDLVWSSDLTEGAAYQVVWELAPRHQFTALFAGSDVQAVGAIRALQAQGFRVPQDVAVVCVNNTDLTRHFIPSLTAVDLHEYWLGYWAVKRLVQTIDGEKTEHPVLIPGELVVRESCGCQPEPQAEGGDGAGAPTRIKPKRNSHQGG